MLKIGNSFFSVVSGFIFLAAAILHGYRAFYKLDLVFGGWMVPMWISWVATVFAFILALHAFKSLR